MVECSDSAVLAGWKEVGVRTKTARQEVVVNFVQGRDVFVTH